VPRVEVTVTYLELTDPADVRPAPGVAELDLRLVFPPVPAFNRWCYETIGRDWHWRDRLRWSDDDWARYLARPGVRTWEILHAGQRAGYVELATDLEQSTEIVYFGLLPGRTGKGLGGAALTRAIELAWGLPSRRIWLNTCTLDSPYAIANYEARGFRRFKVVTETRELPDAPGPAA
jgi:GNAT superfamily N-acetyltransferase